MCMYVCVCMHVNQCMHLCIWISVCMCTYVWESMYICVRMWITVCMCTNVCELVYVCIHTHVNQAIYVYICIWISVCKRTYVRQSVYVQFVHMYLCIYTFFLYTISIHWFAIPFNSNMNFFLYISVLIKYHKIHFTLSSLPICRCRTISFAFCHWRIEKKWWILDSVNVADTHTPADALRVLHV